MPRVIVPPGARQLLGLRLAHLGSPARLRAHPADAARVQASFAEVEARLFAELEREARAELPAEGVPPDRISMIRALGMRYVGQSWELIVRVPEAARLDGGVVEADSAEAHERRYGHAEPTAPPRS